jgi:hypothetical protein
MPNDSSHPSLKLEQVAKGFSDAEKTIRDLGERFSRLVNAGETAENHSRNIQEASTNLQQLGRSLEELTRELTSTQKRINDVTASAAGILDGSDLKKIGESVSNSHARLDRLEQNIQKSLNNQDQKNETLTASAQTAILDRIEALEINAVKAAEAEKESVELKAELEPAVSQKGSSIFGWLPMPTMGVHSPRMTRLSTRS